MVSEVCCRFKHLNLVGLKTREQRFAVLAQALISLGLNHHKPVHGVGTLIKLFFGIPDLAQSWGGPISIKRDIFKSLDGYKSESTSSCSDLMQNIGALVGKRSQFGKTHGVVRHAAHPKHAKQRAIFHDYG
ncbi:hypothetical protein PsAD14_04819 [Pseudovibrio sp. Ad14]|nr:hypothetical protein PsAD14_04819 [Pseudovibrio sp. Ad14]